MNNIWQKTPSTLSLRKNYVDVWFCDIKKLLTDINGFYSILPKDERIRADKLKVKDKKQQYIITRGYLRQRLSLLTNINPKNFVFEYLEHGKPVLINDARFLDITFNVTHSYEFALIAITQKQKLGIDIEKINHESDHLALMTRFFSKAEQAEFNTLPKTLRAKAFCACWTRKEAFIKAIGAGIFYGLDKFDVTVDPEASNSCINIYKPSLEKWFAKNIPVDSDYVACLVSNQNDINLRYWC